jgi:hypothetical protein
MPGGAKAVMEAFRAALREAAWEKALSYCTPEVRAKAGEYASEEAYLRAFVPIDKFLAEPHWKGRIWTYRENGKGDVSYFGCFLRLSEPPGGPTVSWEWTIEKTAAGWVIGLPAVSVDEWAAQDLARQKRQKEEADARWKALEPRLKGLRTQLTALEQEYRVGQPMRFRLELVNEGQHELSYDHQQVAVNSSMLITREDGGRVPYTAGPYQTGGGRKPINPGETIVLFSRLDIAGQYDMSKPGKYRVQFSGQGLEIGDAITPRDEPESRARRLFPSNTVEIEVKP